MKKNAKPQNDITRQGQHGNRRWLLISAGIAAVFAIGVLIVLLRVKSNPLFAMKIVQIPKPTDPAPLDEAPSIGPKTAPVTIVEYADFGCPACWYWYKSGTLDKLRAKYGDKIRFIWRDYPVITLLSPKAAEAGQCANQQGKFWKFHDAVYNHNGKIKDNDLETYASEIGLNISQFDECLTTHRYQDRVNAEQHEAFSHGFNGAPFFLINNQLLLDSYTTQDFENVIDPLLAPK